MYRATYNFLHRKHPISISHQILLLTLSGATSNAQSVQHSPHKLSPVWGPDNKVNPRRTSVWIWLHASAWCGDPIHACLWSYKMTANCWLRPAACTAARTADCSRLLALLKIGQMGRKDSSICPQNEMSGGFFGALSRAENQWKSYKTFIISFLWRWKGDR